MQLSVEKKGGSKCSIPFSPSTGTEDYKLIDLKVFIEMNFDMLKKCFQLFEIQIKTKRDETFELINKIKVKQAKMPHNLITKTRKKMWKISKTNGNTFEVSLMNGQQNYRK